MLRNEQVQHSPLLILPKNGETLYMVLAQVNRVEASRHSLYKFYIGTNLTRRFHCDSLPPFIRNKFSFIHAREQEYKLIPNEDLYELDCYRWQQYTHNNPEYKYIGWRLSDTIYIVVLTLDELKELQGRE